MSNGRTAAGTGPTTYVDVNVAIARIVRVHVRVHVCVHVRVRVRRIEATKSTFTLVRINAHR
jgi:hypothetical protein